MSEWDSFTIRLGHEDVQQAIGELAEQYEKDGNPQDRRLLEVAFMRWLRACVRDHLRNPTYYTLGPDVNTTQRWYEHLTDARNEQIRMIGAFGPSVKPLDRGRFESLEAAAEALAQLLLPAFDTIYSSPKLRHPVAVALVAEGRSDWILSTAPTLAFSREIYYLLRRPDSTPPQDKEAEGLMWTHQTVGEIAAEPPEAPDKKDNDAQRAVALARHLLQYGWVRGSTELLYLIAAHLNYKGHRASLLITSPAEEDGFTLYQLRTREDAIGLDLTGSTVRTVHEIDIENVAVRLRDGMTVVREASVRESVAQALAQLGIGDLELLTHPAPGEPSYLYYYLYQPGTWKPGAWMAAPADPRHHSAAAGARERQIDRKRPPS